MDLSVTKRQQEPLMMKAIEASIMTNDLPREQNIATIFKEYKARLTNFIAKRVGPKEDVEDILQDVFYSLSKVDLIEKPIEQMSSWLYSVANNRIIDKSRKHKEVEIPYITTQDNDELFLTEITDLLSDEYSSPEIEYLRSLVWTELDTALSELPDEQRSVFELTELEGFSFKEISEATNIPVNTLLSRKRYAVLHLRERMRNLYEELLDKDS